MTTDKQCPDGNVCDCVDLSNGDYAPCPKRNDPSRRIAALETDLAFQREKVRELTAINTRLRAALVEAEFEIIQDGKYSKQTVIERIRAIADGTAK